MLRLFSPDALGREATPRGAEVVVEESAKEGALVAYMV